jgi:tetratricopeptide (TPR) repeat protein
LQELGEKVKALADIDRVLEIKPDLAEAIRLRIVLLITDKKYDEAVAGLEKIRQQNPRDEAILLQLGEIYHLQKKYDKAVEIYSAGLAEHPDEWQFLRARGDAQLNWGHRAEAIVDLDKALTLQPKDVGILNNLAWVLATAPEQKLRDGKRALLLATEASQLTEYKQDYILSTLAAAYAETGDFASAEKWAAKGIELSSKENIDEMKKELASYQAHKPWRESLPQPEEKKEEKKPEQKKP